MWFEERSLPLTTDIEHELIPALDETLLGPSMEKLLQNLSTKAR